MKKFITLILCVAMMASMAVMANAAVQLPDGGQVRPTGHSRAYGYTDGGSSGRAYMNCTIKFETSNYGDLLATTASNINIGNKASILLIAWQNNNELRSNEGNSGSSVKTSYSLPLRGGAATTMGTSAHNYSSAEYGDWICGIEISK